jgi:hypothetical protein
MDFKDYRIEYTLNGEISNVLVVSPSSEKAIAHIKSIYPEATSVVCLEGDVDETN